jgi:hypothetical protein
MAYKAFPAVTTAYRPNYRRNEDRYYSKGNNFEIEFRVTGALHTAPTEAMKHAVSAALDATAQAGKRWVAADTPVDTGLLRSRWYGMPVRWNEWRLSNDIFYGPFNERRVRMLERNLPKIQGELGRQLDAAIPRELNR